MLKLLLPKCHRLQVLFNYELLSSVGTSSRVYLAGKYKQDENYFKNIVRKTTTTKQDVEELKEEYVERGKMPVLNIRDTPRRMRVKEHEVEETVVGGAEMERPKRINKNEKKKIEVAQVKELSKSLKKVYEENTSGKQAEFEETEKFDDGRRSQDITIGKNSNKFTRYDDRGEGGGEFNRRNEQFKNRYSGDTADRGYKSYESRGDDRRPQRYPESDRPNERFKKSYSNDRPEYENRRKQFDDDDDNRRPKRYPKFEGGENERFKKKNYSNDRPEYGQRKKFDDNREQPQRYPRFESGGESGRQSERFENNSNENQREESSDRGRSKRYPPRYEEGGRNRKTEKAQKLTPYEKSIFERQQRESEMSLETAEVDQAELVNEQETLGEQQSSKKRGSLKQVRSFYELDDGKGKFKPMKVDKSGEQEHGLTIQSDVQNELEAVQLPAEALDEAQLTQEYIKNLKPTHRPFVYNLACFVNDSKVLQKFIEMGIEIQHWDKQRDVCEFILKLDFDRDVAPYLIFLHDLGCKTENSAFIINKNPLFLKESLENLKIRTKYLESKKFTKEEIVHIVSRAPKWLSLPVEEIDRNLGWYQQQFKLNAAELRAIIVDKPKLAIISLKIPADMRFALKEFLSYSDDQIKTMIKTAPKLFTKTSEIIKNNYNYLVNVMKMSDATISECPQVLYMPFVKLKTRYAFLKHLKRDQFDPSKPNFVSLRDIDNIDDDVFCKKVAHSSIADYEKFLKSI